MRIVYRWFVLALVFVLAFSMAGCSGVSGPEAPSIPESSDTQAPPAPEADALPSTDGEPSSRQEEPGGEKQDAEGSSSDPLEQESGSAAEDEPPVEPQKETAYASGTVLLKADDGFYFYELKFVDGELVSCWLESEEGKGGWGGDTPNDIEKCRFYGMTVEEASAKLESDNCTVTIQ